MRELTKPIKTILLLSPIIIIYVVFIGGGLLSVLIESTGFIPALGLTNISFESYLTLFRETTFLESLVFSLYIALTATIASTVLGILIAYKMILTTNRFLRLCVDSMLKLGLILPYLYVVFLTVLFLGKTGFISRVLFSISWIKGIEDFPRLVYDPYGFGIILVYVLKGTPFIGLFVLNIMSSMSMNYHQVAATLGAKPWVILKRIYLPLGANTISWTSSIFFVYTFGAFEVPYLLGTNRYISLSSKLYSLYLSPHIAQIPTSMAMNILLLGLGSIATFIYVWAMKYLLKGGVK